MPGPTKTLSYVGIAASAVLGAVCLLTVGSIADFVRDFIATYRSDLTIPASTALLFTHARMIRHSASAVGILILLAGIVSVRCASDSDRALRRAILFSIFSSALSSIALLVALVSLFRPFIGGVIMQSPLP